MLFPTLTKKKLRQEISHQGGSQLCYRMGKERMELGPTFTQNHNDHPTEDAVARDPPNEMADGVSVLSLGWHQGLV